MTREYLLKKKKFSSKKKKHNMKNVLLCPFFPLDFTEKSS